MPTIAHNRRVPPLVGQIAQHNKQPLPKLQRRKVKLRLTFCQRKKGRRFAPARTYYPVQQRPLLDVAKRARPLLLHRPLRVQKLLRHFAYKAKQLQQPFFKEVARPRHKLAAVPLQHLLTLKLLKRTACAKRQPAFSDGAWAGRRQNGSQVLRTGITDTLPNLSKVCRSVSNLRQTFFFSECSRSAVRNVTPTGRPPTTAGDAPSVWYKGGRRSRFLANFGRSHTSSTV